MESEGEEESEEEEEERDSNDVNGAEDGAVGWLFDRSFLKAALRQ